MLIRNITDLIGASLALFLGLILKAVFPHMLRRLTDGQEVVAAAATPEQGG